MAQRGTARLRDAHGGVFGIGCINNALHSVKNNLWKIRTDDGTQAFHIGLEMLRLVEIGSGGVQAGTLFFQSFTGFFNGAAEGVFDLTSGIARP